MTLIRPLLIGAVASVGALSLLAFFLLYKAAPDSGDISDFLLPHPNCQSSVRTCEIQVIVTPADQCATEISNIAVTTTVDLSEVSDIQKHDGPSRVTVYFCFQPSVQNHCDQAITMIDSAAAPLPHTNDVVAKNAREDAAMMALEYLESQNVASGKVYERFTGNRFPNIGLADQITLFLNMGVLLTFGELSTECIKNAA